MTGYRYVARQEADTAMLASALAERMGPGTVVALDGDLGAGKTTFSQTVARTLGVDETVNSPTFTIIKEYEGAELPFYHMDVYRITEVEAGGLGLDDYFFGDGVTLVEWADRIGSLLPDERLAIHIAYDGGGGVRTFRLAPYGEPYAAWCEALRLTGMLEHEDDAGAGGIGG